MTYVRTKLALESLEDGAVLEVLATGRGALANVPRSAREEGHEVLALESRDDGSHRLLLRKREGTYMATVRIPTSLRALAGQKSEVRVAGTTVGDVLLEPGPRPPGTGRAPVRRAGRGAPLHQRLPQRRGHPLPPGAGHARGRRGPAHPLPAMAGG